jgi:hypothetical protein
MNLVTYLKTTSNLHGIRKSLKNLVPNISEKLINLTIAEELLFKPLYKRYLHRHTGKLALPESRDINIIGELSATGIYVTSLEALNIPGFSRFILLGNQLFQDLEKKSQGQKVKFQATPEFSLLLKYCEIFQWGLSDRLTAIASNYIGSPAAYDTCLCNLSINNGNETATRRWHLDNEDRKVIKILVYFSDVNEDSGPFQYLESKLTNHILQIANNKYEFFSDSKILNLAPGAQKRQSCVGKAGTVIFVDTARLYHRGKPPIRKPRKAITFGYCSRRPSHPFRCGRNLLDREELEQLAKGLSSYQKDCIFWQDQLSPWVRKIPKYSYI